MTRLAARTSAASASHSAMGGVFYAAMPDPAPQTALATADFDYALPPELIAAGRAEMIKHEVIGGVKSCELGVKSCELETLSPAEIAGNLMVKVGRVRDDPFETLGKRIMLNCGHTVAHAVEKATGYGVTHGEAVAIGCVEEAKLAVRHGLAPASWPDELAARFAAAGLPTTLPEGISMEKLLPLMRGDKKRDGGSVVFALPCGWGDVRGTKIDLSGEGLL